MADIRNRVKELRTVRYGDLVPNPANWRGHPEQQRKAYAGIVDSIGFAGAALARELDDGRLMLIDGHMRRETHPDAELPVLVTDLTEDEANTVLATYDPISAMAEADAAALDSLLRNVNSDNADVQAMLAALAESAGLYQDTPQAGEDAGAQIDRAEELRELWQTERGQLWVIPSKTARGEHRLLCGDSTNADDVGRVMAGDSPRLMVTDPPYGVEYDPEWRNEAAEKGLIAFAASREGKVANDDRVDWTEAWQLSPADVVYCWHAGRHASAVQVSLENVGYEMRSQIIWAKPNFAISRGHYHWQHEPCWYAVRKGATAEWIGDRSQTTLWQIPMHDDTNQKSHGTQKPNECMARPMRNHAGDVYDPFGGSGTTMAAAEKLGRRCYMLELEPKYVAVILERMQGMGLEPRLA